VSLACHSGRHATPHGRGPRARDPEALEKTGLKLSQMDVIELNEAFAAQALASERRDLGFPMTPPTSTRTAERSLSAILWVRPGARLVTTALYQLQAIKGRYALCTMCISA